MKGKKSAPKKASKPAKKTTAKKASTPAKKSTLKKVSAPAKKSVAKKVSAPAKSTLKKVSAPAKKVASKKIAATTSKRPAKKSAALTKKSVSKKTAAPAKKIEAPVFDAAFWLKSFRTSMDIYLELSDENPFKADIVNEMEDCLAQALKLETNNVQTLILFAAFRLDFNEKLNEAMKFLQKAEKLSPGNKKVRTLTQRCEKAMNAAAKKTTTKKAATPTNKSAPKKAASPAKKKQTNESPNAAEIERLMNAIKSNQEALLDMDEDDEERDGILEDTEICLIEVLKLDGNHIPALIQFAEFWLDRGDNLEDAMRYLQRADKLSPKNKQIQKLIKDCQTAMTNA